jgi:hypothetical protein
MVRFQRYYVGYRRAGLGRMEALRFAWLLATAGVGLIPVRISSRR